MDNLQHWESLIGSRMRPTVCQAIEDPVKRNSKAAAKRWKQNHKKQVQATYKKWLDANPDKKKLYQERNKKNIKAWAEAHHDRILELNRINDAKRRKTEKRKNWTKEYRQRPEVKEKLREYDRKRNQTPERKAYDRERCKRRREAKRAEKLLQQQGIENENRKNRFPAEA